MPGSDELITKNIIHNMFEGVMVIGFDGVVAFTNDAALDILGFGKEDLVGRKFASLFFDSKENDSFTQTVLDAVYDREHTHQSVVLYKRQDKVCHLRVTTSFLQSGEHKVGVILVFSDLSELMDLRDTVKSMEKIKKLNEQLEMRNELLSETFGRYLSDDIVKQLLDTPDGLKLGGQKKEITILMSDLRGFTALCERMDPQNLITILNHYFAAMADTIQKWDGTIIEFLGDGILAIFGAPIESDSHAANAVAAAIEMQASMEDINRWNLSHNYPVLEMGIGINTGDSIVGNLGSEKSTKYGVVGAGVNLCGRIESYTINGQILIPESTRNAIGCEITIAKELTVQPKGVNGDIHLMQVTGIGAPYNLSIDVKSTTPDELREAIPVCFHLLDEKHISEASLYGGIVALSQDMAVLETGSDMNIYDNIQINAGGKLYCKVVEKKDDRYLIHFVSVPSGYSDFLKSHNIDTEKKYLS